MTLIIAQFVASGLNLHAILLIVRFAMQDRQKLYNQYKYVNNPMTTTTTGEITTIKFRNAENGWSVFSVAEVGNDNRTTTCTGILPDFCAVGSIVTVEGEQERSKNGTQIKATSVIPEKPSTTTELGVIRLLCRLPGIGEKKATKAVEEYGPEQAWELVKTDASRIGVNGYNVKKAQEIASMLVESYEATVYMLSIGLTDHQSQKILKYFGIGEAEKIVKNDPYRLTEIDGFGFRTVDGIALKAGMPCGAPSRIAECIRYIFDQSELSGGNVWMHWGKLCAIAIDELEESAKNSRVAVVGSPDNMAVKAEIANLEKAGHVEIERESGRVFSSRLLRAEKIILEACGG